MISSRQSSAPLDCTADSIKESLLYPILKRVFDVVMASLGLLLLVPVGVAIALFVKLSDGGPIFYTQVRIGRFGRPFQIRKFRSMVVNADKIGLPVTKEEDPRITWIGRLLRKTKLDELPQLWNVLVGEMSFVGPRPEVPQYVNSYTSEQREILRHKPGITDMATLMFRNEEALLRGSQDVEAFYVQHCLPRKIALNRQYAERASLRQDIWIIVQTLCPYWFGVLTVYGLALTVSLWMTYQLRFDFQVTHQTYRELWHFLPWMVIPQVFLLIWIGQIRGLMSYFSIPELRQTATALGVALLFQLGLGFFSQSRLAPSNSIILIHFMVSFLSLCALRMTFRFIRERSCRSQGKNETAVCRVAIIGTGELATNLAIDLSRSNDTGRRVVAFFDDDPRSWHKRPHDIPVVGMPECILNREWLDELDEIIVALPDDESSRAQEIGALLKGSRLKVSFVSTWPLLRPVAI
jgi:lipopolysaccharide/colanic/teichoic acid biosynthesis glycosyltransferase